MSTVAAPKPFNGEPPASYITDYASSLRNSRVAASMRTYQSFSRVPPGWPPIEPGKLNSPRSRGFPPRFVLVPPNGQHLMVDWGQICDVRRHDGSYLYDFRKAPLVTFSVEDESYYVYGNEGLWSGRDGPATKALAGIDASGYGEMLAFRVDQKRRVTVAFEQPDFRAIMRPVVQASGVRFTAADRSTDELSYTEYMEIPPAHSKEGEVLERHAAAAISADFRAVIALSDGRLRVCEPDGVLGTNQSGNLDILTVRSLDEKLPFIPKTLSIVPPRLMILSGDSARTTLHSVNHAGSEEWRADVGFGSGQPPIDGANGLVYIAGNGLAAVDGGRVLWSMSSQAPMRATAFEDGSLAVAVGDELRFIARDGSVKQVLRTTEHDVITTPPAIAHDGTVWVATLEGLYAAK